MTIRLRDNREPLVDVRKYCPGVVVALNRERLAREKTAYLRRGVATRLRAAQHLLPRGWHFILRDAWRPTYVQVKIFFEFIERFQRAASRRTHREIVKEVNKFVAPWQGSGASGHMTGGAIDVRLVDARGRRVPMVSHKLSYAENAMPHSPKLPRHLAHNRKIMADALAIVGFSNCHNEYWHWSYGDYYWAKREKRARTLYAPVADARHLYAGLDCPCGKATTTFEKCHGRQKPWAEG